MFAVWALPGSIPIQDFQPITSPIDEQEQMTGQGILFESADDDSAETIESFSHVGLAERHKDTSTDGNA